MYKTAQEIAYSILVKMAEPNILTEEQIQRDLAAPTPQHPGSRGYIPVSSSIAPQGPTPAQRQDAENNSNMIFGEGRRRDMRHTAGPQAGYRGGMPTPGPEIVRYLNDNGRETFLTAEGKNPYLRTQGQAPAPAPPAAASPAAASPAAASPAAASPAAAPTTTLGTRRPINLNAPRNAEQARKYSPELIARWNAQYAAKQQRLGKAPAQQAAPAQTPAPAYTQQSHAPAKPVFTQNTLQQSQSLPNTMQTRIQPAPGTFTASALRPQSLQKA